MCKTNSSFYFLQTTFYKEILISSNVAVDKLLFIYYNFNRNYSINSKLCQMLKDGRDVL